MQFYIIKLKFGLFVGEELNGNANLPARKRIILMIGYVDVVDVKGEVGAVTHDCQPVGAAGVNGRTVGVIN